MRRFVLHLLLILDLLVCPLLCPAGPACAAAAPINCGASEIREGVGPTVEHRGGCPCCCRHKAPEPPPAEDPPEPARDGGPRHCPLDCICKGAVLDRAVTPDAQFFAGWVGALPPVLSPPAATSAVALQAPDPFPTHTGRKVRTCLMSYLC